MAKKKTAKKKTTRKKKVNKNEDKWMELIATSSKKSSKYSMKETFNVDDVIDHPKFGPGIVTALQGDQKIEVTFRDLTRLLVHNR